MAKSSKPKDRKPILIYINGEIAAKVLQFSRILGLSRSIIIENLMTQRLKDSLPSVEKELMLLTSNTPTTDDTSNMTDPWQPDVDSSWLKGS
jgi:hypothetical protein